MILGVEKGKEIADEDFTDYPFWKLNGNTALNIFDNRWQTVTLTISDGIRSRLGKASEARLLIVRRHRKSAADVTGGVSRTQSQRFLSYFADLCGGFQIPA